MKKNDTITPANFFNNHTEDTNNQKVIQPEATISLSDLDIESDRLQGKLQDQNRTIGLFKIQSANQWIDEAKIRPIPKMLFDSFWYESEICILFADTNLGKSILGVQIGNSISRGEPIAGFRFEAQPQKVIYVDFELSDKQFENRYSNNYQDHYHWHENFERAEINPDAEIPEAFTDFEEYLNFSLEEAVHLTGAKILIIDNLTYLKNETEKARNALPLMKSLKAMKSRHGLSILALAHTPKRDLSKPITRNDLQGSKMLINFCDSSFAIGESTQDKSIRYLKQIKVRNTENLYDTENVIVCQIHKPHNYLAFEFLDFGSEKEHLRQVSQEDQDELNKQIIQLWQANPNRSQRSIAKELGTYHRKVGRVIEHYENENGT